jgi:hypothetical protein
LLFDGAWRVVLRSREHHLISRTSNPMSVAFWNIIHDGTIETLAGQVPGDVVLTIGIGYLCEHLSTAGDTLEATLRGCGLFAYTPFGESAVTDLQRIAGHQIEVLSAVPHADRIVTCCANGSLEVAYAAVEVRTVEGKLVSQPELEAAANHSVAEWLERNRRG